MDLHISDFLQLIVGLSILFVWVCRTHVQSAYRVGNAKSLAEEFEEAGFSQHVFTVVSILKPIFAFLLVIGIVYEPFFIPCMLFTTLGMIGAMYAHLKVKDAFSKWWPAALLLLFCFIIFTCPSKWA